MTNNCGEIASMYEKMNKPYSRCGHACVEFNGLVYLFGGHHEDIEIEIKRNYLVNQVIDVNIYNPKTNEFSYNIGKSKEYAPLLRYGHTCVVYNGLIYLWGGLIYPTEMTNQLGDSNLYTYDPKENVWDIMLAYNRPNSRNGHTACIIGDEMYVFGGFVHKQSRCCDHLYKLDFLTNCWTKIKSQSDAVPSPRYLHTATAIESCIYVYGGRCFNSDNNIDESFGGISSGIIHKYDTITKAWSIFGKQLPIGLRTHSAVGYKNKIIIFGGYYNPDYQNMLFIVDTELVSYEVKMTNLISRGKHISCLFQDELYLIGGTGPSGNYNKDDDYAILSSIINKYKQMCVKDYLESNKENLNYKENAKLTYLSSFDEEDDEVYFLDIFNEFGCDYISQVQVICLNTKD